MGESIFVRIIRGDEPGEIVHSDGQVVILLSRAPLKPGHSLVVPRKQVEFFYQLPTDEYARLMEVVRQYARVLDEIFKPKTVAMQFMGLGVPHVHAHVVPIDTEADLDHDRAVFGGLEPLRPIGDKIRAYLAEHPISSLQ